MKCPSCDEVMRTVEIDYDDAPEVYTLDEDTGRYIYSYYSEDHDLDFHLKCGECGCRLPPKVMETFWGYIAAYHAA